MGFPSLSAGRPRPACRGWTQGPDGCGRGARRLPSGGSVSGKEQVRTLSCVLLTTGRACGAAPLCGSVLRRPLMGLASQTNPRGRGARLRGTAAGVLAAAGWGSRAGYGWRRASAGGCRHCARCGWRGPPASTPPRAAAPDRRRSAPAIAGDGAGPHGEAENFHGGALCEHRDVPCPRGTSAGITDAQSARPPTPSAETLAATTPARNGLSAILWTEPGPGRPKVRPGRRGQGGPWPFGRGGREGRAAMVVSVRIPTWRSA